MEEKEPKIPKRVAVYIRVSTEDQLDGYGADTQKAAVLGLIEARKNTIEPLVFAGNKHVYFDEGVSGTIPLEERPAFARLKEAIELAPEDNKPFDAVIVYRIDRFARKLKILLDVIGFFEDHEVQFLSVTENIDTSNPFGRAIVSIIGVIAELEIETLKQRTQGGREHAIKDGKFMGNAPPFGYIKDENGRLKLLKKEVVHVKMIFDLFVYKKYSVGEIAKYLKEHKVLSPVASAILNKKRKGDIRKANSNFHWSHEAVRRVLREDLYTGKYYYSKTKNGKQLSRDKWKLSDFTVPIMIDLVTFDKARGLLAELKHNQRHAGKRPHSYILTGLLRCNACYDHKKHEERRQHWVGSPKKVKSTGRYSYYYSCGRKSTSKYEKVCDVLPFPAKEIEEYVANFCLNLLKSPVSVFKHQQKLQSSKVEMKLLQKKLDELNKLLLGLPKRKKILLEQNEHGYIGEKELKEKMTEIAKSEELYREEVENIQRQVSENTLSDKYMGTLSLFDTQYQKMLADIQKHPSEVQEILKMLIDEIVVYARPVTAKDKIAGRPKKKQQIAHRLHIKLKLPQDILNEIGKQEVLIKDGSSQEHIIGAR